MEYAYRGFHAHFARGVLQNSVFRHNVRGAQFQESTVAMEDCRIVDNLNGLQFRNSEVNLLRLEVARNHWGVRCVYSEVTMVGCRFENNLTNGVSLRDSSLQATGNRVANNRKGLYLQRSRGTIRGNLLENNSEHGILLEQSDCQIGENRIAGNGRAGVRWIDSTGELRRNHLVANGEYALVNDGGSEMTADGNWWGTVSPEAIMALVRDGLDRPGTGLVAIGTPLEKAPRLPQPVFSP